MLSRTPAQRAVVSVSAPIYGANCKRLAAARGARPRKLTRCDAVRGGVTAPAQARAGALIYRVEYSRMRTETPHRPDCPIPGDRNGDSHTSAGRNCECPRS